MIRASKVGLDLGSDAVLAPVDVAAIESYSLRDGVPDRVERMVHRFLGSEYDKPVDLRSKPANEGVLGLRAGIVLDAVRMLHEYGSIRASEGEWMDNRAMWVYHKLRLWEHDDTMTQKQQVFAIFQIGKTSFWMRVRAVEALEYVREIPFDAITSCPHRTVWYALADRIISEHTTGVQWVDRDGALVTDQRIIDWLTSGLGANDLVIEIGNREEPTVEQRIDRLIGQAVAMDTILRDRGIVLVQPDRTGLANIPKNGIIRGHDIISGESMVVARVPVAVHIYCPRCGSEIDPARLVVREEDNGD